MGAGSMSAATSRGVPLPGPRTRSFFGSVGVVVGLVVALAPGFAVAADATTKRRAATTEEERGPFGGGVWLTTSLGRGTFNSGPDHQPLVNLDLSLRPRYTFDFERDIALRLRFDVSADLVENAHGGGTERQQVLASDLLLSGTWGELAEVEAVDLTLSAAFGVVFPTSLASDHAGKLLGLQAAVTATFEPSPWLELAYTLTATKNFNRYDVATLDAGDFAVTPSARPGGAEALGGALTATGAGVTEWGLTHTLWADFAPVEGLSIWLGWSLTQAWTNKAIPKDDRSSAHAVGGRGQSDVMTGGLEVGYAVHELLSVALGTSVSQTPKTLDNTSFRFPFWDTTNGSLNRQVFYLATRFTW